MRVVDIEVKLRISSEQVPQPLERREIAPHRIEAIEDVPHALVLRRQVAHERFDAIELAVPCADDRCGPEQLGGRVQARVYELVDDHGVRVFDQSCSLRN